MPSRSITLLIGGREWVSLHDMAIAGNIIEFIEKKAKPGRQRDRDKG